MSVINPKQQMVADLYVKCGDMVKAYEMAYECSRESALKGYRRLLEKKEFKDYLDSLVADNNIMSRDEALGMMSKIARGDIMWKSLVKDEEVDVRPSVREAKSALDTLIKWHDEKDSSGDFDFYDSLEQIVGAIREGMDEI